MSRTELGLLRHGQTDWNINLRLQGTADIPMNEVGIAQIQVAAAELAKGNWISYSPPRWQSQAFR